MNPDEKITSVQTSENRSDSSGKSSAEPPVLLEKSTQAQNQPQDRALLNVQSTSASSQGVQSKSSEIINVSQKLNLQTEKQSLANPPQSSSQNVASNLEEDELRITESLSSEPNFQFENQPPASQSVPKLCVDDKCSIQSNFVEIRMSPQNESQIEQQFEHSEAENRSKEDKNITIKRAEDAIEELSDALPSPTNQSPPEDKKEKVEDSCMMKFWKSRMKIARKQLSRVDYAILFTVSVLVEIAYPFIYNNINTDGGFDIFLSIVIANPICWSIMLFMDRGLLTEKFYSFFPCCNRHEVKSIVKKSQHAPSVETNAAFQHEVADIGNTSPQALSHIPGRAQESRDSPSTDQASELQAIANVAIHKSAQSPEYEGACGYSSGFTSEGGEYSSGFTSGAYEYSSGLEGSVDFCYTDRLPEKHVLINVDVHKANNESAENLAEADSQLAIDAGVHKDHESSENPAEDTSGCGHSSGSGGEKASHDP